MIKGLRGKLTYANIVATVALFVAMGGGVAYAATSVPKHSVGTAQLKAKAVTAPKLADMAVTGRKVSRGAIGTKQLAAHAVSNSKIADSAITSPKLANGSVTLSDLAGADISGAISLPSIDPHTCDFVDLAVPDAQVGQFPLLSFVGNVALPSTIAPFALKVDGSGSVRAKFCNIADTATTATSSIGVHVITVS